MIRYRAALLAAAMLILAIEGSRAEEHSAEAVYDIPSGPWIHLR